MKIGAVIFVLCFIIFEYFPGVQFTQRCATAHVPKLYKVRVSCPSTTALDLNGTPGLKGKLVLVK